MKNIRPRNGIFSCISLAGGKNKEKHELAGSYMYLVREFIRTPSIDVPESRLHRRDSNQRGDSSSKSVVSQGNLTTKVFARENCNTQIARNSYCRMAGKKNEETKLPSILRIPSLKWLQVECSSKEKYIMFFIIAPVTCVVTLRCAWDDDEHNN